MKNVKIILQVDGEQKEFWVTRATEKEVKELRNEINLTITENTSWHE